MKRKQVILFILTIVLAGCSAKTTNNTKQKEAKISERTTDTKQPEDKKESNTPETKNSNQGWKQISTKDDLKPKCFTENGFYHIESVVDNNADAMVGVTPVKYMLCYTDIKTAKEIYLCNKPDCAHSDDSCNAYLALQNVNNNSVLFTDQRYLYLLTSPLDDEGVSETTYIAPGYEDMFANEESPATLYRLNLDGTDCKKLLELKDGEIVDKNCFMDEGNLYLVIKTLKKEKIEDKTDFIMAATKKLVKISLDDYTREDVMDISPEDNVIGCHADNLLLERIQYDSKYSNEDILKKDNISEIENSKVVKIIKKTLSNQKETLLKELKKKGEKSYAVDKGYFYYSIAGDGKINKVDIENGEESVLTKIACENIYKKLDGILLCSRYLEKGKKYDNKTQIVNLETAEVKDATLLDSNGDLFSVEGENEKYCLINKGQNEKMAYGFITKEDFCNQKNNVKDIVLLKDEVMR